MGTTVVDNAPTDEYGIKKAPEFWMKNLVDRMCPQDVMNDPDRQGEAVARGFGAIPAAWAGYVMDELSPVDTNGSIRVPVPMAGLAIDGAEQARYQQEHAEAEEKAKAEA